MDKDVIKNIAVNGAAIGMSFTQLEQALRLAKTFYYLSSQIAVQLKD